MKRQILATVVSVLFLGCAAPQATIPAPTTVYGPLDQRATPLPVTKSSTRDPEEKAVIGKLPATEAPATKPEPGKDAPRDDAAPKNDAPPKEEVAPSKEAAATGTKPSDATKSDAPKTDGTPASGTKNETPKPGAKPTDAKKSGKDPLAL